MALDFGKLNFSVSFNPTSAFPLDARSYFENYESALAAAQSAKEAGDSTTVYYYGQTVCVVNLETPSAQLYVITPVSDAEAGTVGTLVEVGQKIEIDENQFVFDGDTLELYNFASASAGAQLTKGSDGKLSWVLPDNTTVEGLSTSVTSLNVTVNGTEEDPSTGLVSRTTALEGRVDDIDDDISSIQTDLGTKANAADVYTKTETNSAITSAVSSAGHLKRSVVAELPSVSDANADTIYMVKDLTVTGEDKYKEYMLIEGELVVIGDTSIDLSPYATNSDLATKADASTVTSLTEVVDGHTTTIGTIQSSLSAAQGDITALQAAVKTKADASSLANYLTIATAAETYATKTEVTDLNDTISTTLLDYIKTTDADDKYVAKDGYVAFTSEEKTKLTGIEEGSQVNILEAVSVAGTDMTITDKKVNIPKATSETYGVVKLSNDFNTNEDGEVSVKTVNVNTLAQTEGDTLILNGGTSI